jgi:hypothetical protein
MAVPWLSMPTAVLAAAVAAGLVAGCSSGAGPAAGAPASSTTTIRATPSETSTSSRAATQSPTPAPRPAASPSALPVAPGAGARPQTSASPHTRSTAFRHAMADLWLAVTTGHPALARPAFFPLAAYRQVKAIYDPAADWRDRLWHDFTLDVAAAHRLVGRHARLDRVIVPSGDAAWVSPGACYNRIGYWHVPQSRVVYRSGHGKVRSFGIASLISWRGDWYVVHFGAVLRGAAVGIVDQPAAGPGQPGPPGGC